MNWCIIYEHVVTTKQMGTEDTTSDTTTSTTPKNEIELKACDIKVKAKSKEEDFESMMEKCSAEIENIMEYHLYGEYQEIEKKNGLEILLGDD